MSKKRRPHSAQFKAQFGLDALKGIERVHAIAAKHKVHPVFASVGVLFGVTDLLVRSKFTF